MSLPNTIDALIDAQAIIMQARIATLSLSSIHSKLARISDYLDSQAGELLTSAENKGE